MSEAENTSPSYTNPLNPTLRLRLDDVVLGGAGEVKVIVTADNASAAVAQGILSESLGGASITPIAGGKSFAITQQPEDASSQPSNARMRGRARDLIDRIASLASLDTCLECWPCVAKRELDCLPVVRILFNRREPPSRDLGIVLSYLLHDRMEQETGGRTVLETLGLTNARGIQTEIRNNVGGSDFITCDLDDPTAYSHQVAAEEAAKKLAGNVAGALGISDAAKSRVR